MNEETNRLIKLIKFSPFIIILLLSMVVMTIMYQEHEHDLQEEIQFTQTQYIENEKEIIQETTKTIINYIKDEREKSEKNLKKDLKHKINIAHKIATSIYEKNKGTLSKELIIKLIKDAVTVMRHNQGNGYFSIHTSKGINILHPINQKFEGTSVLNRKDAKGNYPVQEAVKIANTKGEGFFSWYYIKPNDKSKEFKKIGIVKKFEPYDFVITTAIYIDDYEKILQNNILLELSKFRYKNNGFLTVVNYEGKVILHSSKKVLNHNLLTEKKFSHVAEIFKKVISKKDIIPGYFFTYEPIVTLGTNTKEEKIIYANKFEDWKWIISTSFTLSDANKIIEKRKKFIEQRYDNQKTNIFIYGIASTFILLLISFFLASIIKKRFLEYIQREKKSIDDKLKIKEEFNNFFELSINLQLISTVEGNIVQINNASKSMLGYEKDELISTSFIDLLHADDVDSTIKELSMLSNGKNVYYFENRYKHKDGSYINLAWTATTNKDKKLIYATAQNTTHAKLLQEEEKQKDQLIFEQSKMASMGEMIGNIAHQWRQPLSVIATSATSMIMQKEVNSLSDEVLTNTCESINSNAQYLSKTIDDFKNFIKGNREKCRFKLTNEINSCISLINGTIKNNNINLILDLQDDIKINGYENELTQCLINIFNNAKDALNEKEISDKYIFLTSEMINNQVFIKIKDNAGGIPVEVLPKIFEPYFTTKHESKGTGLGLHMSYKLIVDGMKGKLKASNIKYEYMGKDYVGAEFEIMIPNE